MELVNCMWRLLCCLRWSVQLSASSLMLRIFMNKWECTKSNKGLVFCAPAVSNIESVQKIESQFQISTQIQNEVYSKICNSMLPQLKANAAQVCLISKKIMDIWNATFHTEWQALILDLRQFRHFIHFRVLKGSGYSQVQYLQIKTMSQVQYLQIKG